MLDLLLDLNQGVPQLGVDLLGDPEHVGDGLHGLVVVVGHAGGLHRGLAHLLLGVAAGVAFQLDDLGKKSCFLTVPLRNRS